MKKLLFLFLFPALLPANTNNLSGLYIRLNESSCIACTKIQYFALSRMLSPDTYFIVPEVNNTSLIEGIKKSLGDTVQFYKSDSLYRYMPKSEISTLVYCHGELLNQVAGLASKPSLFIGLQNTPCFNTANSKITKVEGIEHSTKVSFQQFDANTYLLKDVVKKEIHLVSHSKKHTYSYNALNKDSLLQTMLTPEEYAFNEYGDSVLGKFMRNLPSKGNFGSVQLKGDTLLVLTTLPYNQNEKGVISRFRKLVLLYYYQGRLLQCLGFEEDFSTNKVIVENGGIYQIRGLLYLSMFHQRTNRRTRPIEIFKWTGEVYEPYMDAGFKFPEDLLANTSDVDIDFTTTCNQGLFYFGYSKYTFYVPHLNTLLLPVEFESINEEVMESTGMLLQSVYASYCTGGFLETFHVEGSEQTLKINSRDNRENYQYDFTGLIPLDARVSICADGLYAYDSYTHEITYYPNAF